MLRKFSKNMEIFDDFIMSRNLPPLSSIVIIWELPPPLVMTSYVKDP
jgi:hypothetical protein